MKISKKEKNLVEKTKICMDAWKKENGAIAYFQNFNLQNARVTFLL